MIHSGKKQYEENGDWLSAETAGGLFGQSILAIANGIVCFGLDNSILFPSYLIVLAKPRPKWRHYRKTTYCLIWDLSSSYIVIMEFGLEGSYISVSLSQSLPRLINNACFDFKTRYVLLPCILDHPYAMYFCYRKVKPVRAEKWEWGRSRIFTFQCVHLPNRIRLTILRYWCSHWLHVC